MKGFEIKFNVYAENQEEADAATKAIKEFISEMASRGIAVSAPKLTSAIEKWKNNLLVTNYFK